jgi:hypothetical protein
VPSPTPRYALARRTLYCQLRGLPENSKRKYSWSEARQQDVPQKRLEL